MTTHRLDDGAVLVTAAIAAVMAALGGASPTGSSTVDSLLVIASVAFATWASATAPWWAVTALAGVSAALAGAAPWAMVGLLATIAGLWMGLTRRDSPVLRAAVTGIALNVLIRSELDGIFGLSAIVGVGCTIGVLTLGMQRRSRRATWCVIVGVGSAGVLGLLAIVGLAAAGASAATALRDGSESARAGLDLLDDGEYGRAGDEFARAADRFDDADSALRQPWGQPARLVPVVAQHRTMTVELASSAAAASRTLSEALARIEPEQLRLVNGRIDLAAVEEIEQPLLDVQTAIAELDETLDDIASPWLVAPLRDRLADLDGDLAHVAPRLDRAVRAAQLAPSMLGADGERRYFVAFTTPAQTAGSGGVLNNWAEVVADRGRLTIADAGRTVDLNHGSTSGAGTGRTIDGPHDWIDQWGEYGFTSGPNGGTEPKPWSNVTISPQFPSTASVIAQLYSQSGGTDVDGVFAMDPFALAALLGMTGPITVDGAAGELDEQSLAQFVLFGQHALDDGGEGADRLEAASQTTINRVFGAALPNPMRLAQVLSPLAAQGRFVAWSSRVEEQSLFDSIRLSGALPVLDGGDGIAIVLNNADENELDMYLERELTYVAAVDEATGAVTATATVVLTNTAPSAALPDAAIGTANDNPPRTNRVLLSLYSALPVERATVASSDVEVGNSALSGSATQHVTSAEPLAIARGTEAGWLVGTAVVLIPPDGRVTITYDLAGTLATTTPYSLSLRPQPIAIDEVQHVRVTTSSGRQLIEGAGPASEPRTLRSNDD